MTTVELLTILALLLGPLAAVQLTMWLERGRKAEERRQAIFSTLMATRTQRLSALHVNALNMIDVEFYADKKYAAIRDSWHAYLDSLAAQPSESIFVERQRLFYELLQVMGRALGYSFEVTALKQTVYIPQAHTDFERDQTIVRQGVLSLLTGKLAIPVQVLEAPPEGQAEAIAALQTAASPSLPTPHPNDGSDGAK